jgi:hypothetical protein
MTTQMRIALLTDLTGVSESLDKRLGFVRIDSSSSLIEEGALAVLCMVEMLTMGAMGHFFLN